MAGPDQQRSDPLGDVINLIAAPIAGGIRQYEQFRRGVEELFRAIDNVNTTMENLNEAAARLNRLMADVEEPIRAMLPQITRTVKAADELVEVFGGPAKKVAPNLVRITDTLGSPAFTSLPQQIGEVLAMMGDVSRRMTPLTHLAESAGGLLGLRLPGLTMRPPAGPEPPTAATTPTATVETHSPATAATTAAKQPTAKTSTAKTSTTKKPATKKPAKSSARNKPAKSAARKKSAAKRT